MRKGWKRLVALMLAAGMAVGLTACGDKDIDAGKSNNADKGNEVVKERPLVVGYGTFSEKFSPFYAETTHDQDAVELTQISLLTTDRVGSIVKNAIDGETISYNGTAYTYKGVADIDWFYDSATDTTTYTCTIRDDLKFSDGEPVTADDIIFTYYVYLDNSYTGTSTLNSFDIVGLKNYRWNSSTAENVDVSNDEIADLLANPTEEMKQYMLDCIAGLLEDELAWCNSEWENYADMYGCKSALDLFRMYYAAPLNPEYSIDGKNDETVLVEVAEMYGTNYVALASNYGDSTLFDADMADKAEKLITEEKTANGEEVPNITGIRKTGDYSVEIVTNGFEASAVYTIFGIYVAPMHYYGDVSLYDYNNNQFGFTRGDLSMVEAKSSAPIGAGPYVFKEYKDDTIYYEANPYYFKGEPKIKELQFKEIRVSKIASYVEDGTVDCGEMTGSVTRFQEVKGYNSNNEVSGDIITTSKVDNRGYGYIGLNANTVNVGGEPDSEESKALRKGLMTLMSVYRDDAIASYYGEAATVVNYPISNTSWAAPQMTDEDYKVAYSTDVDGDPIYQSEMSAEEKYAAALNAAVGFFKAAGYTWDETTGKFIDAPEGAKLSYEVIIPGGGNGEHPAYSLLMEVKTALESIGFELVINDPADTSFLWEALDAGTQEMWSAAWQTEIDPDMYQNYHSSSIIGKGGSDLNSYHIASDELDSLIVAARQSDDEGYRRAVYKKAMEIILDWAVELPLYQRQNCIIFSTERINMETVTPDITTFYGWMSEIENMEMK